MSDDVYFRDDLSTRDAAISEPTRTWQEILAALDEAGVPDDFLVEREQSAAQERLDL